jgi:hypothetical protein
MPRPPRISVPVSHLAQLPHSKIRTIDLYKSLTTALSVPRETDSVQPAWNYRPMILANIE